MSDITKDGLGPDGKEWAKTEAGYDHVDAMMKRADDPQRVMWHGWALREAFVAGAEWQEARLNPPTAPSGDVVKAAEIAGPFQDECDAKTRGMEKLHAAAVGLDHPRIDTNQATVTTLWAHGKPVAMTTIILSEFNTSYAAILTKHLPSPATAGDWVLVPRSELAEIKTFFNSVAVQRAKFGAIATRALQLSHMVASMLSATPSPQSPAPSGLTDFAALLERQREFSFRTFGPGPRHQGNIDHIRKELREIEEAPSDLEEWIDVAMLAIDGAWREGHSIEAILQQWAAKQAKNELRAWPDWRTADRSKAIEHDRLTTPNVTEK